MPQDSQEQFQQFFLQLQAVPARGERSERSTAVKVTHVDLEELHRPS